MNGAGIELPKTASVNGQLENEFYAVQEGDDIKVRNFYTVQEVAEFVDVPLGGKILVNDTPAKADTRVYENFTLNWDVNSEVTFADLEEETEEDAEQRRAAKAAVAVNTEESKERLISEMHLQTKSSPESGRTDTVADEKTEETTEETTASETAAEHETTGPVKITVIVNKLPVVLSGKSSYVFVDVFSFIDFDLKNSGGRGIVTKLNGRNAEYMEPLKDGDVIEIYWE